MSDKIEFIKIGTVRRAANNEGGRYAPSGVSIEFTTTVTIQPEDVVRIKHGEQYSTFNVTSVEAHRTKPGETPRLVVIAAEYGYHGSKMSKNKRLCLTQLIDIDVEHSVDKEYKEQLRKDSCLC